jgi:hypothetical protein
MASVKTVETRPCNCKSEFQDKLYGRGNRLHTLPQGGKRTGATCTVCGVKK